MTQYLPRATRLRIDTLRWANAAGAGDLTYADAFDHDATPGGSLDSGSAVSGAKWDAWSRLTSFLFAKACTQNPCVALHCDLYRFPLQGLLYIMQHYCTT